jgi:hypothetical protein
MTVRFPTAQRFEAPRKCRDCGKPAGQLLSHRNERIGDFCERHAMQHIKDSHKRGDFMPDAVLDGKC